MMIFINFCHSSSHVHLLHGGCHIEIIRAIQYLMQYFHSNIILCSCQVAVHVFLVIALKLQAVTGAVRN